MAILAATRGMGVGAVMELILMPNGWIGPSRRQAANTEAPTLSPAVIGRVQKAWRDAAYLRRSHGEVYRLRGVPRALDRLGLAYAGVPGHR